jgi:hypothetical protein
MTLTIILQLLAKFGPPAIDLIDKLISKVETSGAVTPEEWAELSGPLRLTANDHMLARLSAAGIDPNSNQGKTLLGLTV